MNSEMVEKVAKAILYEGYMLYPYRPSSVKNRQRFNFGVVYPREYAEQQAGSDLWSEQAECLVEGDDAGSVEVRLRYLQLVDLRVEELANPQPAAGENPSFQPVECLEVDGRRFYSWQEAIEREVRLGVANLKELLANTQEVSFEHAENSALEDLRDSDGQLRGRLVRSQKAIQGTILLSGLAAGTGVFRISVQIANTTPFGPKQENREAALMHSLVSAHIVIGARGGQLVSSLEPPERFRDAVAECHNVGLFPVLVGSDSQRDTLLASPIILYDYPQIAPESAGDLFDGTEIDEILSLRILTMTDDEKAEMRQSDARAREMLQRTETLPAEQLMKLHGVLRGLRPVHEDSQ